MIGGLKQGRLLQKELILRQSLNFKLFILFIIPPGTNLIVVLYILFCFFV